MATYERWKAGEKITPAKLNAMIPSYIEQGSDLSKTNSTFADTDLTFTPDVSATYYYSLLVSYGATDVADAKWAWVATQATFNRFCYGLSPTGTPAAVDTGNPGLLRRPAEGTAFAVSGVTGGNTLFLSGWERGTFTTTATPGVITLQFAQGTTNATASIFRGGNNSRLTYQRIA